MGGFPVTRPVGLVAEAFKHHRGHSLPGLSRGDSRAPFGK
jgi:hypothetical protein